jgi:hypothetical protein
MVIKVRYSSVDGCKRNATFGTLARAQAWAQEWIGKGNVGTNYAVSNDGIGKIECEGCRIEELFPDGC